jgi:CheY-like chemotaxis protein
MEACKQIIKRDPAAKIIFVTAHALDEFKSKAEAAGAVSFISKPFRVSDIESVLEKIGVCSTNSIETSPTDSHCILNPKASELYAVAGKAKPPPPAVVLPSAPPLVSLPPVPSPPLPVGYTSTPPSVRAKRASVVSRSLKVLYAEDNLINQKVFTRVLNRTGITDVTIVDNGQKAVEAVATTQFDCVFMDYEMPIMDGMEATEIIMKEHPNSKVVFVTAHVLEEYKKKAAQIGAKDFLAKPVKVDDVEVVLKKLDLCY